MAKVSDLCWALVWYALSVILYFQMPTHLPQTVLPFFLIIVFFIVYMNLEE